MTYRDFEKRAIELTVVNDKDTDAVYLRPDWMYKIMKLWKEFKDSHEGEMYQLSDVGDMLKLEVERRRAIRSKVDRVAAWLHDIATSVIDPYVEEQENELMANVIEYMKTNKTLKDKEAELAEKEDVLKKKEALNQFVPGINFSKMKS